MHLLKAKVYFCCVARCVLGSWVGVGLGFHQYHYHKSQPSFSKVKAGAKSCGEKLRKVEAAWFKFLTRGFLIEPKKKERKRTEKRSLKLTNYKLQLLTTADSPPFSALLHAKLRIRVSLSYREQNSKENSRCPSQREIRRVSGTLAKLFINYTDVYVSVVGL